MAGRDGLSPRRRRLPGGAGSALPALLLLAALAGCSDSGGPTGPGSRAAGMEVISGAAQRALPGRSLAEPVVVRVVDAEGRAVAGVTVSFAPAAGHGETDPALAATGADGRAASTWTLGAGLGVQTLRVSGADTVVSVDAEAVDLESELDALFAPATASEVEAVRSDWAGRDVSARGVTVELVEGFNLGGKACTLRILSHQVAGVRHLGAVIVPDGSSAGSRPLLVYLHGGDSGVSLDELQIIAFALGPLVDRFVYVVPSFRGEPLRHDGRNWTSDGPASPWDHDVDDTLALVNAAFESTPAARPGGFAVVGGSRGAGVALLAGIRDERIERIVSLFGPTDFFDDWVREIVHEAAAGTPRDLTAVAHLDSTVIAPYIRGEMLLPEARLEIIRRSAVLFAEDLPPVQLHHGTDDEIVSVSQAESLVRTMDALGRTPPGFEAFIYAGGGHSTLSLPGLIPRAAEFLRDWFDSLTSR